MIAADRNICVLALATALQPEDCYFCGQPEAAHTRRGKLCPGDRVTRQPRRHYQATGWQDFATLGLILGVYYSFRTDRYVWFDPLTLSQTIDDLLRDVPLIVSYQGASFAGPLMWQCYKESPDGVTAYSLDDRIINLMHRGWMDLWASSYDLREEILAVNPDLRFEADAITLTQLCRMTLGQERLLASVQFTQLWRQGFYGQALSALHFDVWCVRALFERICNGQVLVLGTGREVALSPPPRHT